MLRLRTTPGNGLAQEPVWGLRRREAVARRGKRIKEDKMSVLGIVLIAVAVVIVATAVLFLWPRVRLGRRERELRERRDRAASEHRREAELRTRRAEEAEQRARIAEQEARLERSEAQLRQEKASLHEHGRADDELIEEHEREELAPTSASEPQLDDNQNAGVLGRFRHRESRR
jgi:uncharacterized protein HemX